MLIKSAYAGIISRYTYFRENMIRAHFSILDIIKHVIQPLNAAEEETNCSSCSSSSSSSSSSSRISSSSIGEMNTSKAELRGAKYPREKTKIRRFSRPNCRAANLQSYY